jgi:NDP-sugar pyrophosphorylase family protein
MAITTAVLLAAGIGTRLQPLTFSTPKPLLEVAGKPILVHILDNLCAGGVEKFIVVIRPDLESVFKNIIPMDLYDITFAFQETPTGMSDAILTAREFVNDDFAVCAGDMIVPPDHVADMLASHDNARPFGTLSVFASPVEYLPGYGNVLLDDEGNVIKIIEKPPREQLLGNVYSLPFYIFSKDMFDYLDICPLSARGERELQDAIQLAIIDQKPFRGVLMEKQFSKDEMTFKAELSSLNITDVADYLAANNLFIANAGVVVPKGLYCTLIEPVLIKEDCTIAEDALIGPNAIVGQGTSIGQLTEISNAIIQDGCKIGKQCYIERAIVMQGREIEDGSQIRGEPGNVVVLD